MSGQKAGSYGSEGLWAFIVSSFIDRSFFFVLILFTILSTFHFNFIHKFPGLIFVLFLVSFPADNGIG
jgi:hypothetical protein